MEKEEKIRKLEGLYDKTYYPAGISMISH